MKRQAETTYDIVRACVPRGTAEKLARAMARSPETVNRWGRAPQDDDESPAGTGALNPLDVVEAIQDHSFAHAPAESHRIHLYFQKRHERFTSAMQPKQFSLFNRDKELSDVVREHAEFLQSALENLPPDRVRKAWEELKREGEELVRGIEQQAERLRVVGGSREKNLA